MLSPSEVPLNHAITRSPFGSGSIKEAWLEANGGIIYASMVPSEAFRRTPSNFGSAFAVIAKIKNQKKSLKLLKVIPSI